MSYNKYSRIQLIQTNLVRGLRMVNTIESSLLNPIWPNIMIGRGKYGRLFNYDQFSQGDDWGLVK